MALWMRLDNFFGGIISGFSTQSGQGMWPSQETWLCSEIEAKVDFLGPHEIHQMTKNSKIFEGSRDLTCQKLHKVKIFRTFLFSQKQFRPTKFWCNHFRPKDGFRKKSESFEL
jgi:hypothetical protein